MYKSQNTAGVIRVNEIATAITSEKFLGVDDEVFLQQDA